MPDVLWNVEHPIESSVGGTFSERLPQTSLKNTSTKQKISENKFYGLKPEHRDFYNIQSVYKL